MRIKKMGAQAFACAVAVAFAFGVGSHAVLANEEQEAGIDIRLPIVVLSASEGIGVGLMGMENMGAEEDALIGASGPEGVRVEIHLTGGEDDDGVVQMNEIEGLHLSGGSVALMSPDGLHLMLFDMDPETELGDFIPMTLNFEKAGSIEIEALVLDELPPKEIAMAAYLDLDPEQVFAEIEAARTETYDDRLDQGPEVVYVPVYIPVPAMPGGYGHGMGYGFDPMGYGGGHGMDDGVDPMGYGGMPEPYFH